MVPMLMQHTGSGIGFPHQVVRLVVPMVMHHTGSEIGFSPQVTGFLAPILGDACAWTPIFVVGCTSSVQAECARRHSGPRNSWEMRGQGDRQNCHPHSSHRARCGVGVQLEIAADSSEDWSSFHSTSAEEDHPGFHPGKPEIAADSG